MAVAVGVALLAGAACTKLVDVDLGAGIGATCLRDTECQGSSCLDGICTRRCADDAGCPGGTVCASEICELPLRVGFVYPFPLGQDELAQSLDLGRLAAEGQLPYLDAEVIDDQPLAADAADAAVGLLDRGSSVIVAASSTHAGAFASFAAEHGDVTVLSFQSPQAGENLISFDARMYQAFYLAGYAAGKRTSSRRLGIIGSVATPPVVAQINAFALGAKRALEPSGQLATIEVRWIGAWHDESPPVGGETKELRDTRALLEACADVIAHTLDNNIPTIAVETEPPCATVTEAFGIAANLQGACAGAPGSCLGAAYFNWGPLLTRVFADVQRGMAQPIVLEGLQTGEAESAVGFVAGPASPAGLASELSGVRAELAAQPGVGPVFDGPLVSSACTQATGASPCVAAGARLDDAGLARMCWFLDDVGLVERPQGVDVAAVVPATCATSLP